MTASPAHRVGWPDVAKGICIILVVLWHVVTKHAIDVAGAGPVTDAWAMLNAQLLPLRIPLFFLVSGMFAARAVLADDGSSWRRRAARLSLLYVVWVLIQTFVLALAPDFDTARATDGWELLAQLTISPTNLWYLLALAVYLAIGRLTRALPTAVVLSVAFVVAAAAGAGVIPDLGNLWQLVQNLFFFLVGLRLRAVVECFAKSVGVWRTLALAAVYVAALALVARPRHPPAAGSVARARADRGGVRGVAQRAPRSAGGSDRATVALDRAAHPADLRAAHDAARAHRCGGWMLRDGGRRRCSKPSALSC